MTPKEKAEELYATYRFAMAHPKTPFGIYKDDIAKQCALIAVDEILNWHLEFLFISKDSVGHLYWEEVKQEIEKL